MTFDDISIRYHGFQPSDYTKAYWDSIMHEVYDEAPYGALVQATLSKRNEVYKGIIKINSSVGPFFTAATGNNPYSVAKKLLEQMRKRISKWKAKRFHNDAQKYKYIVNKGGNYDSDVA
jgi:hypothetical protein